MTYQIEGNLDQMEHWASELQQGRCGGKRIAGTELILEGIKFKASERRSLPQAEKAAEEGESASSLCPL